MSVNPLKDVSKTLEGFEFSSAWFLVAVFLGLLWFTSSILELNLGPTFETIFLSSPVWLPFVLVVVFWKIWIKYIRAKSINKQEYVLLEIRLPREVVRSPLAMETVLSNIHIGMGETTFINRSFQGKVRSWYSLEMVSLGGEIHFYIYTSKFLRDVVEAQIYGQYPMVEIHEVDDYAKKLRYSTDAYDLWGCDFKLTKKDAYPIKTYIDYGLDKDPKEEFKIDPMAGFFEFLGHIGPDEQLWFQILIRTNKDKLKDDRKYKGGSLFTQTTSWKEEAKEEIDEIRDNATPKYTDEQGKERSGFPNPTPGETDTIKALERSISKLGFDIGIRGIYISKSGKFNPSNIAGLTSSFKQLNSGSLNGFAPTRWFIGYDYPWQDLFGWKKERNKREIIDAYKRRSYFHEPYKTPPFVLNVEELATIFHFPGSVVQAPTLPRVQSTKGEAPSNLPIG